MTKHRRTAFISLAIDNRRIKRSMKHSLLMYVALVLAYIGINIGLLCGNFVSQETIESEYFATFHYLEFWAVFVFASVESMILISLEVRFAVCA